MLEGKFDLNDFLKQMKMLKKMGGISSLLGMLPGAKKIDLSQVDENEIQIDENEIQIDENEIQVDENDIQINENEIQKDSQKIPENQTGQKILAEYCFCSQILYIYSKDS